MIFITVGSRSFQFDRLLKAVDKAIEKSEIQDDVFAQIGSSEYMPKQFDSTDFLNHDEFNKYIEQCDIVITHGGTGIIVNSIKKGKKVIAVPRLAKFHEAVDDHQIQLINEFEKMEMIVACYDCDKIGKAISQSVLKEPVVYHSNTNKIIQSIEGFLKEL